MASVVFAGVASVVGVVAGRLVVAAVQLAAAPMAFVEVRLLAYLVAAVDRELGVGSVVEAAAVVEVAVVAVELERAAVVVVVDGLAAAGGDSVAAGRVGSPALELLLQMNHT